MESRPSSLEFLRAVFWNDKLPLSVRMRAAMAVLPFEAPKLAVTTVLDGKDFASLLEARLRRYKQLEATRQIEARPIEDKPKPEIKPHLPPVHDRRWRRI